MTDIAVVMVVASSLACAGMLVIAWGRAELPRDNLIEQANLALLDAALDLTVVVPYYNPGHLLVPTIERLLSVLDASGASYEVIAVSDGSTDGSDRELDDALADRPQLTNVVLAQNQGKGAALRVRPGQGQGPLPRLSSTPTETSTRSCWTPSRRWCGSTAPTSSSGASATRFQRSSTPSCGGCTRGATSKWYGSVSA